MSLSTGFSWTHKDITLVGYSIAGTTTSVVFKEADVCFDVGQGLPFQISVRNIAITHGHLDHAAGLPYLLGQKTMHNVPAPNVYVPSAMLEPMRQILNLWAEIEDHTYRYNMESLGEGDERLLKHKFVIRSFPTFHRVSSNGYTVYLKRKRLLPEYQSLYQDQLAELRRKGQVIDGFQNEPLLSFTGDTKIEVLDHADVRASKVLVMECTYWDSRRTVEQARDWGHIHLDEIIPRLGELKCEKLVLIHSSARYRKHELEQILDERIPPQFREMVELFPRI